MFVVNPPSIPAITCEQNSCKHIQGKDMRWTSQSGVPIISKMQPHILMPQTKLAMPSIMEQELAHIGARTSLHQWQSQFKQPPQPPLPLSCRCQLLKVIAAPSRNNNQHMGIAGVGYNSMASTNISHQASLLSNIVWCLRRTKTNGRVGTCTTYVGSAPSPSVVSFTRVYMASLSHPSQF